MNPVGELLRSDDIRLDRDIRTSLSCSKKSPRCSRRGTGFPRSVILESLTVRERTGLDGRRSRIRHSARAHESMRELRRRHWYERNSPYPSTHPTAGRCRSFSASSFRTRRTKRICNSWPLLPACSATAVFAISSGPAPIPTRCGRPSRRGRIRRLRRTRPKLDPGCSGPTDLGYPVIRGRVDRTNRRLGGPLSGGLAPDSRRQAHCQRCFRVRAGRRSE